LKLSPKSLSQPNITFRFWEYPKDDCFYFIGFDCAGESDTGANSAARVWKDRPFQLVAEAVGNAKEEVWAKELDKLGRYYAGTVIRDGIRQTYPAWIAIEIFSYGGTVLSMLLNGSDLYGISQYPHIYKMPDTENLRNNIHRPGKKFGWWAGGGDSRFKRSGVLFPCGREVFELANDDENVLPDATGVIEYTNTKQYEGRPDPAPGERIDRVVADCLARLAKKQNLYDGLYPKDVQQRKQEYDFYVDEDEDDGKQKIFFNPLGKPYNSKKKEGWFK